MCTIPCILSVTFPARLPIPLAAAILLAFIVPKVYELKKDEADKVIDTVMTKVQGVYAKVSVHMLRLHRTVIGWCWCCMCMDASEPFAHAHACRSAIVAAAFLSPCSLGSHMLE